MSELNVTRFVEFETAGDLKVAVDKLDGTDFKGNAVRCIADVSLLYSSPINALMSLFSSKKRLPATIGTALAPLPLSVAAATLQPMATTTVVAPLRLGDTAHIAMTTVVALLLPATTTTLVIATIVRRLLVPFVDLPSTSLTHPLAEATASLTRTQVLPHVVEATMIPTPPMAMIDRV